MRNTCMNSRRDILEHHLSEELLGELYTLLFQSHPLRAVHRVMEVTNCRLLAAVTFLDLLLTTTTHDNASESARKASDLTSRLPDLLPTTSSPLAAKVQAQIEHTFPRTDWEGVGAILGLYGQNAHELERERVQL